MSTPSLPPQSAAAIAATLRHLAAAYAATPLLDLPALAARLGVAQVLAKDEGRRALGSFKSLGGTYAGLRALARVAGRSVAELCNAADPARGLPALVCASDGNHGLAVAAAARFAGAPACIFLHKAVPAARARLITAQGAAITWIDGTYDDAVDAAAHAALEGAGILIADTTEDPHDPVVADVMAGYGVMAAEIRDQVGQGARPTHLFVQAGVGGLAAAMAAGLSGWLAAPGLIVVVEPNNVACVGAALAANRPVRLAGALDTGAEMLSCGEASAPALAVLQSCAAQAIAVSEDDLRAAPGLLAATGGPRTTASGAAGLAGLVRAAADAVWTLGPASRILILVTEGEIQE
jgi:diaminopropionate ammonia-lyase